MATALGKIGDAKTAGPPGLPGHVEEVPTRELFLELLVVGLANLYGKVPLASTLFERSMLKAVTGHLPDAESSKLMIRTDDWIRLEGLIRGQEGQKAYTLSLQSLAVLSTETPDGSIGRLMERACDCYVRQAHTPELRQATRRLAAVFLNMMAQT
jgi:hypothetical protein